MNESINDAFARDDMVIAPYQHQLDSAVERVRNGEDANDVLAVLLENVPPQVRASITRRFRFLLKKKPDDTETPHLDFAATPDSLAVSAPVFDGGEPAHHANASMGAGVAVVIESEEPPLQTRNQAAEGVPPMPSHQPAQSGGMMAQMGRKMFGIAQAALLMATGTFDRIRDLVAKRPDVAMRVKELGIKLQRNGVEADLVLLERLEQVRSQAIARVEEQQRQQSQGQGIQRQRNN